MNGPKRMRRALLAALVSLPAARSARAREKGASARTDATARHDAAKGADKGGERRLRLYTVNQKESLDIVYWRDGRAVPEANDKIEHLLRDRRNGERGAIDPKLLDLLHRLRQALDTDEPFHVISAYRSLETNAKRAATPGSGVAQGSLHVRGQAIDIRVPGVPLEKLRDAATALKAGGVGFYPKSDFVHVDVGRVRSWVQEE